MDGLGNDFLIIDNRKQKVYLNEKQIQKLSNRENGIGFDQLIYIEKEGADLRIKYFNSNGKFADACGNGNRCVAKILMDEIKAIMSVFTLETNCMMQNLLVKKLYQSTWEM